ncbi:hypothetical protein EMCRGX_G034958 [Ephydatia muelleri]
MNVTRMRRLFKATCSQKKYLASLSNDRVTAEPVSRYTSTMTTKKTAPNLSDVSDISIEEVEVGIANYNRTVKRIPNEADLKEGQAIRAQLEEKDTFLSRFEAAKQLYAPGCKRNATISVLIECFAGPCIDPTRDVQASSSRTSFSRNEMMLDSADSSTEFVLPQVIAQGLNITEVAHGYQATIKQYVQQLGMVNSYDTWHGTKNVAKQLHRICASMVRTRDRTWFTELFDKARCTKVHLYWCMRNCGGNPDCLRAMIVNISKHFQPGYVPQRKPLTMPAAISAYEAALRKTLIYKKRLGTALGSEDLLLTARGDVVFDFQ